MSDRSRSADQPFRLDLEQQRKRAKELCRDVRAGEAAALARLREHHPQAANGAPAGSLKLADAQLVVARELGLASWRRLREHTDALARSRSAIAAGAAPDAGPTTLHLRCGGDIREALQLAGFQGAFLEYADPLCHGPVRDRPDHLDLRARFIADSYGAALGLTAATVRQRLADEAAALARAASDYQRVVLWFEHDSYDQLILARALAQFAVTGAPPALKLISINHFPGAARFIGLGQLPPEAIRMLWSRRQPLGPEQLAIGRRTWDALRGDDPRPLHTIAQSPTPGLPDLGPALVRHLRELPGAADGLSLTERLTLELLHGDSLTIGQLFGRLMRERDPLPWLGDAMFLAVVEAMARAEAPPFTVEDPDLPWPRRRLHLNATGRDLLAGRCCWLDLGPPERWVGGVRGAPGGPNWRWDEAAERPLRR